MCIIFPYTSQRSPIYICIRFPCIHTHAHMCTCDAHIILLILPYPSICICIRFPCTHTHTHKCIHVTHTQYSEYSHIHIYMHNTPIYHTHAHMCTYNALDKIFNGLYIVVGRQRRPSHCSSAYACVCMWVCVYVCVYVCVCKSRSPVRVFVSVFFVWVCMWECLWVSEFSHCSYAYACSILSHMLGAVYTHWVYTIPRSLHSQTPGVYTPYIYIGTYIYIYVQYILTNARSVNSLYICLRRSCHMAARNEYSTYWIHYMYQNIVSFKGLFCKRDI